MELISLVIGLSSFIAAIVFFFAAKKSETHTIELLSKISQQVQTLESINNNLLGTAIHHLATSNIHIIDKVFPSPPIQAIPRPTMSGLQDDLMKIIYIYFYTARTNYFAHVVKSSIPLTDQTKDIHSLADQAITFSHEDFITTSRILDNWNQIELKNHSLHNVYYDIKTIWESYIINTSST